MKNQINISNLTPEQIEEVRQQLKAFDEKPKSIMDKVKSWEDAKNIIHPVYYIDDCAEIMEDNDFIDEKNVPSQKHAKSILATSQLMVIAEALNEGWKPNYDNQDNKYYVEYNNINGFSAQNWVRICVMPIIFKSEKLARYAIAQFPELWYDYFMIDKPE